MENNEKKEALERVKKAVKNVVTVIVSCAVFLVVLPLLSRGVFYSVSENQYAVVTRFGKIVDVKDAAGLYTKMPVADNIRFVTKAMQLYDVKPSDVITKDKKSMIADNYIVWKITDPTKFMQTLNGSTSGAEDRVGVAVYNATKNIISSMSQDDIIAARGDKLTDMITSAANSDIGGYGIVITKAEIKALDLPDDNKDAVYQRMISERENIAASYTAEGAAKAQKIRNETDKEVSIRKAEAEKQAAELSGEGEAKYMEILADAYNTEEKASFYNYIRSIEAMKKSLSGSGDKTIILDKDSELARILYGDIR